MSCHSDDHNKKRDMLRYYIDQIEQCQEQLIKDKIVRGLDEKPRYMGEKISFVGAFHTEEPQLLYGGARWNGKMTAIFEWAKDMYALYVTLEEELAYVERERDAAVADITTASPCFACKHFERNGGTCGGGKRCLEEMIQAKAEGRKCKGLYWEWRGVQED